MGGAIDFVVRVVAQALSGSVGQPVIVDNRSSGAIQGDVFAKSPTDGHTLLVASIGLWIDAFVWESMPYDVA